MSNNTPPTIAITTNKTSLKAGDTAQITFTLSEVATDFLLSDLSVTGGTLSSFSGSGALYTATFNPNQNSITNGLVSVGNFKFSDSLGNSNEDSADANNSVSLKIDTIRPTISIRAPRTFLGPNETPKITFTLSEPSTNFDVSDIYVVGGTLNSFKGSDTLYSAEFVPKVTSASNFAISVKANQITDNFGNGNEPSSQIFFYPYDASKPNVAWSSLIGAIGSDIAYAIATGLDGSVYVSGFTTNSIDGQITAGQSDAFLTKFSPDGIKIWTKLLGSSFIDSAKALTIGLDGSIYVCGITYGSIDGQSNNGDTDAFLTKYNSDGTKVWTRLMGTQGTESANALTTGLDGSIYVSGYTTNSIDGQIIAGQSDAFLTKFSPDGIKIWTKLLGSSLGGNASALNTGLDGSIYLTGKVLGALHGQSNNGETDVFLTKYNPDGTRVWTQLLGTSEPDESYALTMGLDGSIYVCGVTFGALDGQTNSGSSDAFVSKFNPDGSKAWTSLLKTRNASLISISTGLDGLIYVAGTEYKLGDGTGSQDVWIVCINSDGKLMWNTLLGTDVYDGAQGLTMGLDGSMYICGETYGTFDGKDNIGVDAFVMKLLVPDLSLPKINIFSNKTSLFAGDSTELTFTLNKPTTNFIASDISVEGGKISKFQGSGTNYTATFTSAINMVKVASVKVGNGKFSDVLGVFNEDGGDADNMLSFSIFTIGPTLHGHTYQWKSHELVSDVLIVAGQKQGAANADGNFLIDQIPLGTVGVTAAKELTTFETGNAINSADALAALKIAVGRSPNIDGSPASPYQLIAADVNKDGKVTSADALAILKMAVKRSDALPREWLFVSESQDFWDETANNGQGGYTISRTNVNWNKDLQTTVTQDTTVNLIAVLKGDVNGSWTGATGSQSLPTSYFSDLVSKGLGPLSTWGVVAA